jgi:hypothetical protein
MVKASSHWMTLLVVAILRVPPYFGDPASLVVTRGAELVVGCAWVVGVVCTGAGVVVPASPHDARSTAATTKTMNRYTQPLLMLSLPD